MGGPVGDAVQVGALEGLGQPAAGHLDDLAALDGGAGVEAGGDVDGEDGGGAGVPGDGVGGEFEGGGLGVEPFLRLLVFFLVRYYFVDGGGGCVFVCWFGWF